MIQHWFLSTAVLFSSLLTMGQNSDEVILTINDSPIYTSEFESIFKNYGLINVFLITPQTSSERIIAIDQASDGFIYMVSSASTTRAKEGFGNEHQTYFNRISDMKLNNPQIVGFGISNSQTFNQATEKAKGAIIGSAFIKHLAQHGTEKISEFVAAIR